MDRIKLITIDNNEVLLRKISEEVNFLDDNNLKENINILEKYCKENDVMALAAIQLGISKRIIYLKNTNLDVINRIQTDSITEEDQDYNEARVLINPIIINREGLTEYWENCASCLDNCGLVYRPYKIDLEYFDELGNKHFESFKGFESTVLSHEYDHLDGILHIDISEQVINMPKEERKKWRQTHDYKIYYKTGDYDLLRKQISNKKASL